MPSYTLTFQNYQLYTPNPPAGTNFPSDGGYIYPWTNPQNFILNDSANPAFIANDAVGDGAAQIMVVSNPIINNSISDNEKIVGIQCYATNKVTGVVWDFYAEIKKGSTWSPNSYVGVPSPGVYFNTYVQSVVGGTNDLFGFTSILPSEIDSNFSILYSYTPQSRHVGGGLSAYNVYAVVTTQYITAPKKNKKRFYTSSVDPITNYKQNNPISFAQTSNVLGLGIDYAPASLSGGDATLLSNLKIKIIRAGMRWQNVENNNLGNYDWSYNDSVNTWTTSNNLKILYQLGYGNINYTGLSEFYPPSSTKDVTALLNFVRAAVTRYQGKGIVWEIWNEPNGGVQWLPTSNAGDYLALATKIAQTIKSVSKDEWVAIPALGSFEKFDSTYLTTLFNGGILNYVDAVSMHPYRSTAPETVTSYWSSLKSLIKTYTNKPIFILATEFGYNEIQQGLTYPGTTGSYLPLSYTSTSGSASGNNLLKYSSDITNAVWSPYFAPPFIVSGQSDPFSGNNAFKITPNTTGSSNGLSGIFQVANSINTGSPYSVSVYMKSDSGSVNVGLGLDDNYVERIPVNTTWTQYTMTTIATANAGPMQQRLFEIFFTDSTNTTPIYVINPQSSLRSDLTYAGVFGNIQSKIANYMTRFIQANVSSGITYNIMYQLKDQGPSGSVDPNNHYGLVDYSGNLKPVYTSVSNLT